jgi:4-aminobutyrate aminotransferase-like enzyme
LQGFAAFAERYFFLGEVDGRGLLIGRQLVTDKATREPLSQAATRCWVDECLRRGFLTMAYAANFRIHPATTINKAIVQEI